MKTEFEIMKAAIEREIALKDNAVIKQRQVEFLTNDKGEHTIRVERGYDCFVSVLEFRADGSLFDITAWE